MVLEGKFLQTEIVSKEFTEKTSHAAKALTNGQKDQSTKESFIKETEKEWANLIHLSSSSTKDSTETIDLKASAR